MAEEINSIYKELTKEQLLKLHLNLKDDFRRLNKKFEQTGRKLVLAQEREEIWKKKAASADEELWMFKKFKDGFVNTIQDGLAREMVTLQRESIRMKSQIQHLLEKLEDAKAQ